LEIDGGGYQLKLVIDQSLESKEVEITIRCGLIDPDLERLIAQIRLYCFSLTGKKDGSSYLIKLEDIFYFESTDEKTFIYCSKEVYESDLRLYELEQQLASTNFVRISKSCILNIMKLESVKALLNGKMEANLINDEKVIITRHYLQSVKEKLNL
jgi:DNA-binding LytR/AlgR family response regulator